MRANRVVVAIVVALILFAPLARGTVHVWSIAIAVGLAFLAFAWSGVSYLRRRKPPAVPLLGWVFLAVAAWTVLQTVALPSWLLAAVAPETHSTLSFALGKLGLYGDVAAQPISLDPPATGLAAVVALGLTMAFIVAYRIGRKENGLRAIQVALLGAAALAALLALVLQVFHVSLWPGQSPGADVAASALGIETSFRNPNHFSAFLALALPSAIGFAVELEMPLAKRLLAGGLALALAAAIVFSRSRSGIVALIAGGGLFALLLHRAEASRARRALWGFAIIIAIVASVAVWFGAKRVFAKFSPEAIEREVSDEGRIRIWKDAARLTARYATTGVGRGAFAVAFPSEKSDKQRVTYTHPENEPLVWLSELGVPVGGALLIAVLLALFFLVLSKFALVETAVVAGLAGLALQNMVDFSLEVGGVAFPASVLLGAALGRRSRLREDDLATEGRGAPRRSRLRFVALVVAPAALVATVVYLPSAYDFDRDREIARLDALSTRKSVSHDEWLAAARATLKRHPVDPWLHLRIAGILTREGHRDYDLSLLFLARAMAFNPSASEPHLLAMRHFIAVRNHDQAIVEAKLAAAGDVGLARPVLLELRAAGLLAVEAFERIVESDADRAATLRYLLDIGEREIAKRVATELVAKDRRSVLALAALVEVAFVEKAFDVAEKHATALRAIPEGAAIANRWGAKIANAEGRHEDAVRLYRGALQGDATPFAVLSRIDSSYEFASVLLSLNRGKEAVDVLESISTIDTSEAGRAKLALTLGLAFDQMNDLRRARRELERARRLAPRRADIGWSLVNVLVKSHDFGAAIDLCNELKAIDGEATRADARRLEIEGMKAKSRDSIRRGASPGAR